MRGEDICGPNENCVLYGFCADLDDKTELLNEVHIFDFYASLHQVVDDERWLILNKKFAFVSKFILHMDGFYLFINHKNVMNFQ